MSALSLSGIGAPLAIWAPSGWELVVIMVIALLLFGKRLPEVARNLGKGVVEFKKGLKGVEEDIDQSSYQQPARNQYPQGSYSQAAPPYSETPPQSPTGPGSGGTGTAGPGPSSPTS